VDQARLRFERYLKRRFGQSSTLKHYLSDLSIFARVIGVKDPEAVTPMDVDTFIDHQVAAGLSPTTINRRLSTIRTFFEFLAGESPERGWPNPVINGRHRLKTGSRLPRDVPDEDVARLFAVIDDRRDQAMFGLMVGAGLRVGEVAELRLDGLEEPHQPGGLTKWRVRGKGNKERMVWLTPLLWNTLRAWLEERPSAESNHVFLNHHGNPISVAGIQYRLRVHCQAAGLRLSSHQLRHCFARRLVENGLPVDSLAKLLGHRDLQTTQRYIDGADPTVRADFASAMERLEAALASDRRSLPVPPQFGPVPRSQATHRHRPAQASQAELLKLRALLDSAALPSWLRDAVGAYLSWRWPTWRAQTAHQLGRNFLSVIRRVWAWLAANRQIEGWEDFHRADLEAWLDARIKDGVSLVTIHNELVLTRTLIRFVETRGVSLDPTLFRVRPPRKSGVSLPRYLSETDYRRLEATVLGATEVDTYEACFDRAWFLTLAHTGLRVSELLSLHLEDLDLTAGRATVRGSKPGYDRVVYLTPPLIGALGRYLAHRPELPEEQRFFVLHGRSPSARTIQRRLSLYGQQAGVQVSPHKLRHTIATRLVNQGLPIHSLRKLLGHQHINMTQRYARIYDATLYEQFKEAMSRLDAVAVEDWPGSEIVQVELAEARA
jgi:site-specific recombinase XerD